MKAQSVKMNTEQQAAARSLAVTYAAFNRAMEATKDYTGIIVWGENLRIAQTGTGIELHGEEMLIGCIGRARKAQRVIQDAEKNKLAGARAAKVKAAAARHADRTAKRVKLVQALKDKEAAYDAVVRSLTLRANDGDEGLPMKAAAELREASYAVADAKLKIEVVKYVQRQRANDDRIKTYRMQDEARAAAHTKRTARVWTGALQDPQGLIAALHADYTAKGGKV
jgi:hypothetical protein